MTVTTHTLSTLLDAIDQLRSTPRISLRRRSAALFDEAARPVLERAVSDVKDIHERHRRLAEIFSFSQGDSPREYRTYAAALRRASAFDHFLVKTVVFGWFADDEFKRAQKAWHGARLSRSAATVEEMAQEFERLADHLEAVQGLCSNGRLRTICGDAFDGLATDFDGLLRS